MNSEISRECNFYESEYKAIFYEFVKQKKYSIKEIINSNKSINFKISFHL